jgi:hypothetical protein
MSNALGRLAGPIESADVSLVSSVIVALLLLICASLCKALMEPEMIKQTEQRGRRGRVLFKHFYIAPDLITLSFALLLSSEGIEAFVAHLHGTESTALAHTAPFTLLVAAYVFALLVSLLLWHACGPNKYFEIEAREVLTIDDDGKPSKLTVDYVRYGKGLFKREGCIALIGGNFMGFFCIGTYVWFISST